MSRYHAAHQSLNGPGDARPSAMQIVEDEGLVGKLSDKTMLVTGTSSGIGIETARALAATGAHIFCTVRNVAKGEAALKDILKPGQVEIIQMDQNSLESVRHGAKEYLERSNGKCNVLVCNAGIMACPQAKSADGFESQFAVCHLAHFQLFVLLKDALSNSSSKDFDSRVVMLSSMGHKYGVGVNFADYNFTTPDSYTPWAAYSQAKTANIYMSNEIDRKYGPQGIHSTSLHPGGITTGLQVHVPEEQKAQWATNKEAVAYMKSPAQGAATTVLAAIGKEWEGRGGKYLEDCEVALPDAEAPGSGATKLGYWPHAYDEEKEKRLWQDSLKMIGMEGGA